MKFFRLIAFTLLAIPALAANQTLAQTTPTAMRGTGDLGLVIERAGGSLQVIETSHRTALGRVEGLGDLKEGAARELSAREVRRLFGRA